MNGIILSLLLSALLFLSGCSSSKVRTTEPPALKKVIEQAIDLKGTSYCSAGTTPDCFDCSGFVSYCFATRGIALPRISSDMFSIGEPVTRKNMRGGDLVFFSVTGGRINHVGIALNTDEFIHSSTSRGVIISSLDEPYWNQRYHGARRIVRD